MKDKGTRCYRHRARSETDTFPVTIGSTISLKNVFPFPSEGGFLNTCGYLRDQPDFKGYPDVSFTFGAQLSDRNTSSCSWKIVSATRKRSGEPLVIGDAVHLLNAYASCGYLDTCGTAIGSPTFAGFPEHLMVFTSGIPNRDTGSGTWTVRSALGQPDGTAVREGDAIHLENGFPGGGFLDTCGYVKDVPAFKAFPPAQQVFVFTSTSANRDSGSGTWRIAFNPAIAPSYDKMVPLRDAKYRGYEYTVQLTGRAIAGDPYEINFDTGSWTTSIPYGCLNKAEITVLQGNILDPWGQPADKVSGQLAFISKDGTVTYAVDDYVFFARRSADGSEAPCDRTALWGNSILGGFPSEDPNTGLLSLPYAIAVKYSRPHPIGFGIVSNRQPPTPAGWADFKSYLQIGADPAVVHECQWRTDIPNLHGNSSFCPEIVPGFSLRMQFDAEPDIATVGLVATVDTGAPGLTFRPGQGDPQRTERYKPYFVDNGIWVAWGNQCYDENALSLQANAWMVVEFQDSQGVTSFYGFAPSEEFISPPPTQVTVCDWDGCAPWAIGKGFPQTRINLGNTVYMFCPVYFWDIANKRVGILFD